MASVTYGKCIMANVIMAKIFMAKIFMAKILWQMKLSPILYVSASDRSRDHITGAVLISNLPLNNRE